MAPSLQAQSPGLSSFYLAFPHLPFLCRPLCIIHCQEKGTETRKEGSRKGREGQSFTPLHSQNPKGDGGGARLWSQAPHPLETRIAEEGPHKSEIHYCFYSPGAAGDRDPTFTIEL